MTVFTAYDLLQVTDAFVFLLWMFALMTVYAAWMHNNCGNWIEQSGLVQLRLRIDSRRA